MLSNNLQELEMQLSMLQCKDFFSDEDYELQDKLIEKIRLLKSQQTCRENNLIECLKKLEKGVLTKEAHDQLVKGLKETYSAEEIEKAKELLNA